MRKGSPEELSELPNLVFNKNNLFHSSNKIERVMDLSEIPSPYLSHRLDEFLDGKLLPLLKLIGVVHLLAHFVQKDKVIGLSKT